ncbi:MAG: SpaA isopeptide-forming pilin-related protein, partial [Culicoidibacterales bacterium]
MRENNFTKNVARTMKLVVAMALVFLQLVAPFNVLAAVVEPDIPHPISPFVSATDMDNLYDESYIPLYNGVMFGNMTADQADTEGAVAIQGDTYLSIEGNKSFNWAGNFGGPGNIPGATAQIPPTMRQKIAVLLGGAINVPQAMLNGTISGNKDEAFAGWPPGYFLIDDATIDNVKSQMKTYNTEGKLEVGGPIKTATTAEMASIFALMADQVDTVEGNMQAHVDSVVSAAPIEGFKAKNITMFKEYDIKQSTLDPNVYVVFVPASENGDADLPQASGLTELLGLNPDGSINTNSEKSIIIATDATKVTILDHLANAAGAPMGYQAPEFIQASRSTMYYAPNATQITNFAIVEDVAWDNKNVISPDLNTSMNGTAINPSQPVDEAGNDEYDKAFIGKYRQAKTAITGSIIAPNATLVLGSGNVNGFTTVKDLHLRDGAELHVYYNNLENFLTTKVASKGSIELTKVGSDDPNANLAGAIFELRDEAGVTVMLQPDMVVGATLDVTTGQFTTTTEKTLIQNLPLGKYKLVEIKAPYGYEINPNPNEIPITITTDHVITPYPVSVINKKLFGSIELTKVGSDDPNANLAGAIFELRDEAGVTVMLQPDMVVGATLDVITGQFTTTTEKTLIQNLPLGTYK